MKKTILTLIMATLIIYILSANQNIFFYEDFDSSNYVPEGWSTTGWVRVTQDWGMGGTNCLSVILDEEGGHPTATVTLPTIGPLPPQAKLEFYYALSYWDYLYGGYALTSTVMGLTIQIRVNNQTLYTINNSTHNTAGFALREIDLSSFAGQIVTIEFNGLETGYDDIEFEVDNVKLYTTGMFDNDLAITSIQGSNVVNLGAEEMYFVDVKNIGVNFANDYVVKLYEGNTEIGSQEGTFLISQSSYTHTFTWIANKLGYNHLQAEIVWDSDQNLYNNKSTIFDVNVLQVGLEEIYIGNPDSQTTNFAVPFSYYYRTSISQTIYLDSELNHEGLISEIVYEFNGSPYNIVDPNTNHRIWMAITDKNVFTSLNDWVPYEDFDLVFEGTLPTNIPGWSEIVINLNNTFEYSSGNLVIMCERQYLTHFHLSNEFRVTNSTGFNRTIVANRDADGNYDLENLPTAREMLALYPNIAIRFGVPEVEIPYPPQNVMVEEIIIPVKAYVQYALVTWEAPEDSISRALESYNIYRSTEEDENDFASWVLVVSGVTDLEYLDEEWGMIDETYYYYYVQAEYSNNNLSDFTRSNLIEKKHIVDDSDQYVDILTTTLLGNYPNPFNPTTTISFQVDTDTNVAIEIFNLRGQKICTIVNDYFKAGKYNYIWNGTDDNDKRIASGVYFYRMNANNYSSVRRLVILK